jgi:hypothetical protein
MVLLAGITGYRTTASSYRRTGVCGKRCPEWEGQPRAFIAWWRGNALDLAVGIIIGAAFGKIVTSLVNDLIMPPIGLLLGKVDFSSLFVNLSGRPMESLAAAKAAV